MLGASFATGTAGPVFRANKAATGSQISPKVQLLANDYILYVWQSSVAGTPDIYARIAKPTTISSKTTVTNGTKTKIETSTDSFYGTNFGTIDLRVNAYTKDQQIDPAVAALPGGDAIITWSSYGRTAVCGVFTPARSPARAPLPRPKNSGSINTPSSTSVNLPLPLANGNYVIAWVSEQESFTTVSIFTLGSYPAGAPVTEEIPINSSTNICDTPDVAALNDGGFTVVWAQRDMAVPTNSWDVWGRAFSASGSPEVADFRVNTYLYGNKFRPKIAAGPSGSLVVWTSIGPGRLAGGRLWPLLGRWNRRRGRRDADQYHLDQPAAPSGRGLEWNQQFSRRLDQFRRHDRF